MTPNRARFALSYPARTARTWFILSPLRFLALATALAACATKTAAAGPAGESGALFRGPGGPMYVEVRGNAPGVPLFMVNGGPGFAHDYVHCSDAWDAIAKHRRVVFYDQRGVGRSARLTKNQSCTLADQIEDLEAVRAHVGADHIDLLGHSYGGYLVMAYAARHPEHVRHLMIVDSAAPKWDDTVFLFKDVFPEGMGQQAAVQFAEAMGDTEALATDLSEYFKMLFLSPENRDRYMAIHREYGYVKSVNELLNADFKKYDLNPELPKFRFPTLVICGRYDMNVAPSVAWKIARAIPGARFEVFEKSGHLPYFEEPEKFVRVIEEFLGAP